MVEDRAEPLSAASGEPPTEDGSFLRPGGALQGLLWEELSARLRAEAPVGLGQLVGRYRVVRELGRGGMSIVYLAERADGELRQSVALKLLHLGADAETTLRFEQERRILAALSHPYIARLLDGGIDTNGRAFIAMEHVEGRPIDRYVEERGLDLDARLRLFESVAEAVGYAHRNLVVHRDIKPSNVLVDEDGHVRLLDFGIAKLLDPSLTGGLEAPATRTTARVMTPEYASPEQILGHTVTTASDIYQLGLLLFELLTGQRARSEAGLSPDARARAALELKARPSRLVKGTLARSLRGDLDTIVAAALRAEPERRYASSDALLGDLRRARAGLPIAAHADTLAYRTRKFVGRHRLAVLAATLVVALLGAYAVTVTLQARRIAHEAARTRRVTELLLDLFRASNPGNSKGADPPASELLRRGAARVEAELQDEPELQAEMRAQIGIVLGTMGRYEDAVPLLRAAFETRRRLLGNGHAQTLDTERWLARNLHFLGRYAEAEPIYRDVLERRRALLGDGAAEVTESLMNLGCVLHSRGDLRAAEPLLREALARAERASIPAPELAVARNNLGDLLSDQGRQAEAEPLLRAAGDALRAAFGALDPQYAVAADSLGVALALEGRLDEADGLLTANLERRRRLYAGEHPTLPQSLRSLALLRLRQRRLDEARALIAEALERYARQSGRHPFEARAENTHAEIALAAGQAAEALRQAQATLAWMRAAGHGRHAFLADTLEVLAQALERQGREAEAADARREAAALREATGVLAPGLRPSS